MLPIIEVSVSDDGITDDAAAINAALAADADPCLVIFSKGSAPVCVGHSIMVPSNKTLDLAGRTVKALATFDRAIEINAVIATEPQAVRACVRNGAIDANKVGAGMSLNERIQGLIMDGTVNFEVHRVNVRNCSGYGHLARGDANSFTYFGSGHYLDCSAENCQIHFEAMACDGVLYDFCRSSDGDGDIPCQGWLHPLTGSRNITYSGFRGKGAASTGIEMTANVEAMSNIRVLGSDFDLVNGIGLVTNGVERTTGIQLIGSNFRCAANLGTNIFLADGTAGLCRFEGVGNGVKIAAGCAWAFANSDIEATHPQGGVAYGLAAPSSVSWDGGHISAFSTGGQVPFSGGCVVQPSTRISPNGGGDWLRKKVYGFGGPTSTTSTSGVAVGAYFSDPWTFPVEGGRTYRVRIAGTWAGSPAASGKLGVKGSGGAAGVLNGSMALDISTSARVSAVISAILGINGTGSRVSAAPADGAFHPFEGDFVFQCTAAGALTIEFGTSSATVPMFIGAYAIMVVEGV